MNRDPWNSSSAASYLSASPRRLGIALCATGTAILLSACARNPDATSIQRSLRAQLQPGSTLEQADSVLTSRSIAHSYDADTDTLYAIVRKTAGSNFLIREDLTMRLFFDVNRKLVAFEAEPAYTGP